LARKSQAILGGARKRMKIDRNAVHQKYGGHCAYCGEEITVREMQVDHIHPQFLSHWEKDFDINRFENLNPACRKCNHFKHSFPIDTDPKRVLQSSFRHELENQVVQLSRVSQFERALRFGLVTVTNKSVRFFFEDYQGQGIAPQHNAEAGQQPITGQS
jgi:HNH endonuclease.